jgi:cytochrome P450
MPEEIATADVEGLRQAALGFDLKRLDPAFLADPYPLYQALRTHDPVHRMADGSYFLSRYADCDAVYHDAAT